MTTRITSLNGIRGAAAVWVMLCHFSFFIGRVIGAENPLLALTANGWVAVDFFFILSGFIISYSYPAGTYTKGYGTFLLRRLARIYPLHFVTFAFTFFFIGPDLWGDGPYVADVIRHTTLTHAWWGYSHPIWNGVSWSVSAEWASYLLFPLILAAVMRIRPSRLVPTLACTAVGYVIMGILCANSHLQQIIACGLMRGLPCFAMGIMVFRIFRLNPHPRFHPAKLANVSALALITLIILTMFITYPAWLLVLLFLPLILGLAYRQGVAHRILQNRFFTFMGTISYSIYLVHYVMLKLFQQHTPIGTATGTNALLWLLAIIACTMLASCATYYLIERPGRKWLTGSAHRAHT